jgi:hypothetical protein
MAHAKVDNESSFAVLLSFAADEDGRPLLVPLVQASYEIRAGRTLALAEEQELPSLGGEPWDGDASTSGYKLEPAFAFMKPATDVVLVGHAQCTRKPLAELYVLFRVGTLSRRLLVLGDRVWFRSAGGVVASSPKPFESVPLSYQRAFGGWDRSDADPARHSFEPRNPVGVGFRARGTFREDTALPNIEDPGHRLSAYAQVVAPAGVSFISPDWQPRAALGGTYDEAWLKKRMPRLPRDFDRRFFNAASPGLVALGYLKGNESVLVEGTSRWGRVCFDLPDTPPPSCRVAFARGSDVDVHLHLDTVVVDTDRDRLLLLWRGFTALRDGPHDVRVVAVRTVAAEPRVGLPRRMAAARA